MLRTTGIAGAFQLLAVSSLIYGAQPLTNKFGPQKPPLWDHRLATPSVVMTAIEDTSAARPPELPVGLRGLPYYSFQVTGSPIGAKYQLWSKSLGKEPRLLSLASQSECYVVNEKGRLLMRTDGKSVETHFMLGKDFVRGEPVEYALVSDDGKIIAFDEVIPFPLETTNTAGYRLSLKLSTRRSYTVHAEGFEANQEVRFFGTEGSFLDIDRHSFDARSGMGIFTGKLEDGKLIYDDGKPAFIFFAWEAPHWSAGGTTTIKAVGKSGQVVITFDWGSAIQPVRSNAEVHLLAGAAELSKKQYDNALREFSAAIEIDPRYLQAYLLRATIWFDIKKDYPAASDDFTKAIQLDPTHHFAYAGRGVLRAMCPDAKFRDGPKAVSDLTKACELTGWQDVQYLSDLGAAYAETGDFAKAIKWQTKAIEMAKDKKSVAESGEARLVLYRQSKPFHLPGNPRQ